MYTINIYTRATNEAGSEYVCSISQDTRKQCMKIANAKYAGYGWDWDDKNYVKNKKFCGEPSTTVSLNLISMI